MTASPWSEGRLRPGRLCPFCDGRGNHFALNDRRPLYWTCQPCEGRGAVVCQPDRIRIGTAQHRFLKPIPEPTLA